MIAALKAYFKRRFLTFLVAELEEGGASVDNFKLDIRMALGMCKSAWDEVSTECVRNCWRKAEVLPLLDGMDARADSQAIGSRRGIKVGRLNIPAEAAQCVDLLATLLGHLSLDKTDIATFIADPDEDDIEEPPSDEALVLEALNTGEDSDISECSDEQNMELDLSEELPPSATLAEARKAVKVLEVFAQENATTLGTPAVETLSRLHYQLQKAFIPAGLLQRNLQSYFQTVRASPAAVPSDDELDVATEQDPEYGELRGIDTQLAASAQQDVELVGSAGQENVEQPGSDGEADTQLTGSEDQAELQDVELGSDGENTQLPGTQTVPSSVIEVTYTQQSMRTMGYDGRAQRMSPEEDAVFYSSEEDESCRFK
ncbi:hypothetical protein CYMTET_42093 [Cymbomonas tetramitiformis]|uniref:DDE-1 domain-containing protein n=1 Tax=Cymbomonas tetramitiformis TaxID=36881 RepID=A0AAE0C4U3_9CHLO|nr:hypothetical protein CYMTET_42093 [Cymbomonas tetramitiformis]